MMHVTPDLVRTIHADRRREARRYREARTLQAEQAAADRRTIPTGLLRSVLGRKAVVAKR